VKSVNTFLFILGIFIGTYGIGLYQSGQEAYGIWAMLLGSVAVSKILD
jgi:hypothetical protein